MPPTSETMITGATGFVGGHLLVSLLEQTSRRVICPLRAVSNEDATRRGALRLAELVGEEAASQYRDRVEWIRADIEEERLGWSNARWNQVAARTTEIFHCAASVSFDLPLDQAHRINVDGTKHVFAVARAAARAHGRFERFHHVSTAFVSGKARGVVGPDYLPPDHPARFRNSYERTKARAERYLRAEANDHVRVSIYRPSIIAGLTTTGATTNWNVLYVPMKMVARGSLPVINHGGRELLDTVAVDFLVSAMLTFSQLDAAPLVAHHVTAGHSAFTVTDLIRTTADRASRHRSGYEPSQTLLLRPMSWRLLSTAVGATARLPRRCGPAGRKARLIKRALDQLSVYLSYATVDVVFDAKRDHDLLRVFGVEMPRGADYLDTIIEYALATNFGKVGVTSPQVVAQ